MNKLDLNSLTKEQIAMAMECETPEELIELAKKAGIEITKEEAEAYLDELENMELDKETLDKVAGGDGTTRTINAKLYG
jgi:predicted DNA-binding protein